MANDKKEIPVAKSAAPAAAEGHCLVETVAGVMQSEPTLEAVKLDRARHTISVATLGKPVHGDVDARVSEEIRHLEETESTEHCALLEGSGTCETCPASNAAVSRSRLTVRNEGEATTIERQTCPTAPSFWRWRERPWPKFEPRRVTLPDRDDHEDEWKLQFLAAGLCLVFGLAAYFTGAGSLAIGLYVAAYIAGGWFAVEEIRERLEEGVLDVHFLMLTVAAGSAAIGAWTEGATLLFLFSFSGAMEHYALGRTQKEIRSLFKSAPKVATQLGADGREHVVPVERVTTGMRLLVKPGEQFPVDAEVLTGRTASDESNLTGEAAPVEKAVGDTVLAGTLNLWGAVEVGVLRPAQESALEKIIKLIKEAQHAKAPSQRFTDKFGTRYTYGILSLTLAMFFVWWLGFGHAPFISSATDKSAFYRAMTLLVVASPCALVLSIPSAVLAAIAWAARRGILFRGGAAVEKLAEVDVVALDKTGTLTTGELRLERVESFPAGREREIGELAFALEKLSTHPLARAITRHGRQQGYAAIALQHFESVTGLGLKAQLKGESIWLGKRDWLANVLGAVRFKDVPATELGVSEVWLAKGDLLGRVLLRDDVRPQARAVLLQMHDAKLRTVTLTGDHKSAAEALRQKLPIDDIRSELKPADKVAAIQALTKEGHRVAMVGDGVNDAPSLAAAHVGVAMGARGSDAALEQADVVLMHDRLENFHAAFRLSQRARSIIRQNLVISLGTVVVLVSCAVAGVIPLTLGVVGHEGSTVVVVLNSLRLLFGRQDVLGEEVGKV